MKLHELSGRPGRAQDAKAHRPRHRLGQGQDRRPRRQGPDRALGRAHQGFRGRPDAAASAPAQARLQEHDVRAQAQRSQSRAHPGRRSMPAGSTPAARSTRRRWSRRAFCAAPRTACGSLAAARSRPRSHSRCSARRNRPWRRWRRPAARSKFSPPRRRRANRRPDPHIGAGRPGAADGASADGLCSRTTGSQSQLRGAGQGRRAEEAHLVHARRAARLSARHLHSAAGHRSERLGPDFPAPRPAAFWACSTCSPAAASTAWRSSRSTSCPTSRPRSSFS